MVQLCPHPECTATYHFDTGDEGQTFRCKQCGSLLRYETDGLTLVERSDPERSASAPMSMSIEKQASPPMLNTQAEEKSILSLVISWFLAFLFGFGSLLVVLFFFLPLIDQAGIARQSARIDAGERQQDRLDAKLWNRNARRDLIDPRLDPRFDLRFDPRFDRDRIRDDRFMEKTREPFNPGGPIDLQAPPDDAAQKKRANERKEWAKTRDRLEDELEDSRGNARGRLYFYTWGQLFGFVVLAIASVGFLSFGPTTTRRIFGGIVISAEVLLIFIIFFVQHMDRRFMF